MPTRKAMPRLLSINVDPQRNLNTTFRIAAREGRLDDVKKLLGQGAQINATEKGELTALAYAARHCKPRVVRYLLRAGAKPNPRDSRGRTPLILATRRGCLPAVKTLLAWPKTNPFVADKSGRTASEYIGLALQTRELFEMYGALVN